MNEFAIATKFLLTVVMVVISTVTLSDLGPLSHKMAVAAAHAQQNNQISYGKFSRQLWSAPHRLRVIEAKKHREVK